MAEVSGEVEQQSLGVLGQVLVLEHEKAYLQLSHVVCGEAVLGKKAEIQYQIVFQLPIILCYQRHLRLLLHYSLH